jgi:hypothetical protein
MEEIALYNMKCVFLGVFWRTFVKVIFTDALTSAHPSPQIHVWQLYYKGKVYPKTGHEGPEGE